MTTLSNAATTPNIFVKLSDVAELIRGVTYKKEQARETPGPGYLPVLRANNIQDSTLNVESELVYVPEDNVGSAQRLRAGDIVVAMSSGSKHLVGKSAIVLRSWNGSFGAFCAAIRPRVSIDARYLAAYLQSPGYWRVIREKALGVNINNLRRGDLEALDVPLPPLQAQQEIAAEIDKQFSRLDEAVANLKRVKANLKRYKAAVLKAAVEGRLVPTEAELARKEGRDYETGEQLLQSILKTRRKESKGKSKYTESAASQVAQHDPLPTGWAVATIGECFHVAVGATPSRKEPAYWGGDIPWVSSSEVQFGRVKDTREKISRLGHENSSTQLNPAGSVLIGMIGQGRTRGQSAILEIDATNNQNCAAIWVSKTRVLPEYVFYWLWHRYSETRGEGSGNNQQALNKQLVERIPLPLPPLAEQRRMVSEVERLFSIAQFSERLVDANLARTNVLHSAVLGRAFSSVAAR
ncbi:MAG: restriction endonuclease subunit S [Rhodocyclaceae bacterium]|nr:restriction endonuclease subunit S [Rhodocyclaceae bacterium]